MTNKNRPETSLVTKSGGKTEVYSEHKLAISLSKASVPTDLIPDITNSISKKIYDGVPTKEIRRWIIQDLKDINGGYAYGFEYKKNLVWVVGRADPDRRDIYQPFIKDKITESLIKETSMPEPLAIEIANKTEHFLIENKIKQVSGPLIREIVVQHHLLTGKETDYFFRGRSSIELFRKILHENLISKMDHASYLGQELARAEQALHDKKPYIQDETT